MTDFLVNAGLLILILGTSAWLTSAFTKRMYYKCQKCGSLNAKRRIRCRVCETPIGPTE